MEKQVLQNTFTIITKEEKVKSMDHHIIPNTFVLEITHPFPGYYFSTDFITSSSKPQTLLLILKDEVDIEVFYRKIGHIKKYSEIEFSASLATIQVYNKNYQAIRVNLLQSYDHIVELQKYLMDEGFTFKKPVDIEAKALIKIYKFCSLKYDNGLYYSAGDSNFIYFGIDKEVTWKVFEHITIKIKHNFDNQKFDAAPAVFFHQGNIEDVIRIYTKDIDNTQANKLKDMYLKELANY